MSDESTNHIAQMSAPLIHEDDLLITDKGEGLNHDTLALRFGRWVGDRMRYVGDWGSFVVYNDRAGIWARERQQESHNLIRQFLREEARNFKPQISDRMRSATTLKAVWEMVKSNPGVPAPADLFDSNPLLLGTPCGTVDLRTGELRPASKADHITRMTAVAPADPGERPEVWLAALERIFRHDPALIPFLQRVLGYALTGYTNEQVFVFAYGPGGNGKGLVLNTVSEILGDYAAVAPATLLLDNGQYRPHEAGDAMLQGARLVTAQELARGKRWDEPKLKSLTGGDPITARFMRENFFTYRPQFTLIVAGNTKPSFRGVDEAIKRRVLLLPFTQLFKVEDGTRDTELPEKLKAEWPAILRWMIEGCLQWQQQGLQPPASVATATEAYMDAEDILGQWLNERCIVSPLIKKCPLKELYDSYKDYCVDSGLTIPTKQTFAKALDEKPFDRALRGASGECFAGLCTLKFAANSRDPEVVRLYRERIERDRAEAAAELPDDPPF